MRRHGQTLREPSATDGEAGAWPSSGRSRTRVALVLGLALSVAAGAGGAQEAPDTETGEATPAGPAESLGPEPPGRLSLAVTPSDAVVRVAKADGLGAVPGTALEQFETVDHTAPLRLAAGAYLAYATRPGYRPGTESFSIEALDDKEIAIELERASSVLRIRIEPADAAIRIDGVAQTPGASSDGSCHPECLVDGLYRQRHELEVAREGFRSYRAALQLPVLRDYELPGIVLERQEARLAFLGLPDDAEVTANGGPLDVDRETTPPEAVLVPGSYELSVLHGGGGHFETSVRLGDRERREVEVGLQPALVFLGVPDTHAETAQAVQRTVDAIRDQGAYTVLKAAGGEAILQAAGIDAATLRTDPDRAARELPWSEIRKRFEGEAPATLYLIAVPDREQDAGRVDLWWLGAHPGPARPDVRSVRLRDGQPDVDDLARLDQALRTPVRRQVPRLGLTLLESLTQNALAVAGVEVASPAYVAGLAAGMELLTVNGAEVESAADWRRAVAALGAEDVLEVSGAMPGGEPELYRIEPAWGWSMLDPHDPALLPSAAAAQLVRQLQQPGDAPSWLIELDLAAILMAQGDVEGAARLLRRVDAPGRTGLGRETVAYMTALALSELAEHVDPEYGNQASAAFHDLELAENSRLWSDEGPSVATRSRLQARTSLALAPPRTEILVGEYRAEARVGRSDIVDLRFLVDGRVQATTTRSRPWAKLRLGRYPSQQVIRVEGMGPEGRIVATDELIVNQQRGDLRVRIEEPSAGANVTGRVQARAAVVVPKRRQVSLVEFRVGDEVQAELDRPPWITEIDVPRRSSEGQPIFLTVTATLDDGSSTEDVRFLSTSALTDSIDVDLVELYTTVLDRGNRPVTGLERTDFTVVEDGIRQEIAEFARVQDLPLTLGVTIDTSASMDEVMEETRRAASQFLANLIRPTDTAFAVAFASRPHLLMGQTSDLEAVVDTIRGLRTGGQTALHDALMTSLYYLRGVTGRRALVLLSDGEDTSSAAAFADVLEYARHSEVVIYAIGLGIGHNQAQLLANLDQIASVTGGRAFLIDAARELRPVYRQIERELRSQYLLAYNSNQGRGGDDFREVEVRVSDGRRARTISGYYP